MSQVLFISPIPTHPTTAGNRARVNTLASSLSRNGHDLFFMHIEQEAGDRTILKEVWGDRYVPVPYKKPRSRLAHLLRRIARKINSKRAFQYGIDEWYDPDTDRAINKFLESYPIDIVIVEYVFMSRALLNIPEGIVKILDTHDVFANREQRYIANNMQPTWFSCSPRQEAKGLQRADVVVAIQEDEANYFRACMDVDVVTIGHPVDLVDASVSDIVTGRILLVGSSNPINVSSAQWLIELVFPIVLETFPDAELCIAGTICQALTPVPKVRLLGKLDDLSEAYAGAHLVVNPMLFGTGLKIKSVEALAHNRPLVTTPCGAEGLVSSAQQAFSVASAPEAFAAEITRLLHQPDAAIALGNEGFAYAARFNARIESQIRCLAP